MRNPNRICCGAVVLLAFFAAACGDASEPSLIASAKTYIAKRDAKAAIVEVKRVLIANPDSAEGRFLLGLALLDTGDSAAALVEFDKAEKLKFDDGQLAPKRARALLSLGKPEQLLASYRDRTLAHPTAQAELRAAVARAHGRLSQRQEADAAIESALKADSRHPWAVLTKARFALGRYEIDAALDGVVKAISLDGADGEAHLLHASILQIAKKETDAAIAAYQRAAKDPRYVVDARTALIDLYLVQRKLKDAKLELAELGKSHPRAFATLFEVARIAFIERDLKLSRETLAALLGHSPQDPRLLAMAGSVDLQLGSFPEAEAKLARVVATAPRFPGARKLLAETQLRMGQPDKALNSLGALLEPAAADAGALALAGQAYLHLGNTARAEAMFAAAARANPDSAKLQTSLALSELAKGNADSAFDTLRAIADKDPGQTADLALITSHLQRREFDAALAAVAKLKAKLPNQPTADHLRGVVLQAEGNLVGARAAFTAALATAPAHFASTAALARIDLAEKKPEAARERLQAAVKRDPKSVAAHVGLVNLMSSQGVPSAEIGAALATAIAANPNAPELRIAEIRRLSKAEDLAGARSAAQNALAAIPDHPGLLDTAGQAMLLAGDTQQALRYFQNLAALQPRSPLPLLRLVDTHLLRPDASAALAALKQALGVAPESAQVHLRVLALVKRTKDGKPALVLAKDLQKAQPSSAAGYLLEGDIEALRRNWPAALTAYRVASGKNDPANRAPSRIYDVLLVSGQAAEAARFEASWLQAHPNAVEFLGHLGDLALARKDTAGAERRYMQVLALNPKDVSALNNMAMLLAQRGAKGAVGYAEQALLLSGNQPEMRASLAMALAAEGQLARAILTMQDAVDALPEAPAYRLHLAQFHLRAGDKAKARAELEGLAALGPKFRRQDEVTKLRSQL